jgi:hypothetical protein
VVPEVGGHGPPLITTLSLSSYVNISYKDVETVLLLFGVSFVLSGYNEKDDIGNLRFHTEVASFTVGNDPNHTWYKHKVSGKENKYLCRPL